MNDANQPIELVRGAADSPPGLAPWPSTNWWVLTPVLLVGVAALLTLQLRWQRSRRLSDSERAFRRLASVQRLPMRFRLIARELAVAHGRATPASLLLSDQALVDAAGKLSPKPGSAQDRVLTQWMQRRGLC